MIRLWRHVFAPLFSPFVAALFLALLFAPSRRRRAPDLGGN